MKYYIIMVHMKYCTTSTMLTILQMKHFQQQSKWGADSVKHCKIILFFAVSVSSIKCGACTSSISWPRHTFLYNTMCKTEWGHKRDYVILSKRLGDLSTGCASCDADEERGPPLEGAHLAPGTRHRGQSGAHGEDRSRGRPLTGASLKGEASHGNKY